jgi:hypothetical protein
VPIAFTGLTLGIKPKDAEQSFHHSDVPLNSASSCLTVLGDKVFEEKKNVYFPVCCWQLKESWTGFTS